MKTTAINNDTLKILFDNQKKLDDLFDSTFDDSKYFINISSSSYNTSSYYNDFDLDSQFAYGGGSGLKRSLTAIQGNPISMLLLITLEIGVVYWVGTKLF